MMVQAVCGWPARGSNVKGLCPNTATEVVILAEVVSGDPTGRWDRIFGSLLNREKLMSVSVSLVRESGKRPETWYSGQGIGQFADQDECRRVADEKNVPRLDTFYFEDIDFLEEEVADSVPDEERDAFERRLGEVRGQRPWHDPNEGLRTVQALLPHFRQRAEVEDDPYEYLAAIIEDLEAFELILRDAAAEGDRFRFEVSA
jgi:hypothetical protein